MYRDINIKKVETPLMAKGINYTRTTYNIVHKDYKVTKVLENLIESDLVELYEQIKERLELE